MIIIIIILIIILIIKITIKINIIIINICTKILIIFNIQTILQNYFFLILIKILDKIFEEKKIVICKQINKYITTKVNFI